MDVAGPIAISIGTRRLFARTTGEFIHQIISAGTEIPLIIGPSKYQACSKSADQYKGSKELGTKRFKDYF